jgi:hypothetical protein
MVARQSWILRSPLPSRGALCPSVDCRSIACFPAAGLQPFTIAPLQSVYDGTKNAVCGISGAVPAGGRQGAPFRRLPNRTTNLAAKSETGQRMGDVVIRATALDRRPASEYGVVLSFA